MADGANMAKDAPGIPCFVVGKVRDLDGRAVANATLDLWQTDGEGLYEAQRDVTEPWMRGLYRSQSDGSYVVRTVAPIGYTIPMDGPIGDAGEKNQHLADASGPYPFLHRVRRAITGVVTHLFQRGCQYIETDVVYGVKEPLIVDFVQNTGWQQGAEGREDDEPYYVINYDFVLQKLAKAAAA